MNHSRLRPLMVADLFDEAFDLYKQAFVHLLTVAAALVVIVTAIGLNLSRLWTLMSDFVDAIFTDNYGPFYRVQYSILSWSPYAVFGLLALAVTAVFLSSLMVGISSKFYTAGNCNVPAELNRCLKRLLATVAICVISLMLNCIAVLVLFVPVFFVFPLTVFAVFCVMLNNERVLHSLKVGSKLGSSNLFRLGSALLGVALLVAVAVSVIAGPVIAAATALWNCTVHAAAYDAQAGRVILCVSAAVCATLVFPYLICFTTVLYYDAQIRLAAYDIQYFATQLGYLPPSRYANVLPHVPAVTRAIAAPRHMRGRNAKKDV